jgi:hypothetical protein
MRPLTPLELIIVCILAFAIVIFLTVGFPRQNAKHPCEIIELNGSADYKEGCKNLKEWYEKSS